MTAATDAAAGVWGDDGSFAAFAPALGSAPRPRRPAPRPEPDRTPPPPPAPPRPASRLADLFAEEEREADTVRPAPVAVEEPGPEPEPEPIRVRFAEPETDENAAPADMPAAPVWLGVARGVAGVLAAGCLLDAFAGRGGTFVPSFAPLPAKLAAALAAFCGTGLAVFAARGTLPAVPRSAATLAAAALAGFAASGAATAAGLTPHVLWQTAACAAVVAAAARLAPPLTAGAGRGARIALVAGVAACGVGFPLAGGALTELAPADRRPAAVAVAVGGWWNPAGDRRAAGTPRPD